MNLKLYFIAPIDGHILETLAPVLKYLREMPGNKPVLVRVTTSIEQGYTPAELTQDKHHSGARFDERIAS